MLLVVGLAVGCGSVARGADAARRPNIVVICVDDLGYGELGCYGGQDVPTPRLDALARAGTRFTQGYVTAPLCAPSRAGLLTGRYQTRFGYEFNPVGVRNVDPAIGLPAGEKTLAERLRDAGYSTGLIGKWHLGGTAAFHPQRRGFDEFFGFLHEGHYYVPTPWTGVTTWLRRAALPDGGKGRWTSADGKLVYSTHLGYREPDYDTDNPLLRSSQPVDERQHLTDALTREAESFIARHQERPFLLYLAYNAVHSPMQAADRYLERCKHIEDVHRRIFAAMLAQLDDSVGAVLDTLRTCGLDERTLVIFLSDNGGPTRELTSSNRPLRGEKGDLWEGGIRVPFLMRWKGRLPAERTDDRPVSALDVFATALAAAGVPLAKDQAPLDGVNLLPFLQGPGMREQPHDRLYWRLGGKAALRQGDWKIVRAGPKADAGWQLYNLAGDSAEARDLAAQEAERLQQLEKSWNELNARMAAPAWR
ncbi:MAG: sulfatase-like hydrolase/transferase [Planctomycetia bacterium]|nr:sulfatase-like hydrolase/transferase [Planctomycetia bacterium]